MAKIKLLLQELNFWVEPNLTTKQGFTIKSYHVLPFFLSHDDFLAWLLDTGKIEHNGQYDFVCYDDASELNNLVSEFLTIKFNAEAFVVWPFIDVYSEAKEAPMPIEDRYEHQQRFSGPTVEEMELY